MTVIIIIMVIVMTIVICSMGPRFGAWPERAGTAGGFMRLPIIIRTIFMINNHIHY